MLYTNLNAFLHVLVSTVLQCTTTNVKINSKYKSRCGYSNLSIV